MSNPIRLAGSHHARGDDDARLTAQLTEVAGLGLSAAAATACVIAYSGRSGAGFVQLPTSPMPWAGLEATLTSLSAKPPLARASDSLESFLRLKASAFASGHKNAAVLAERFVLLAGVARDDCAWSAVGLLLDLRRRGPELEAQVRLLSRLVMSAMKNAAGAASRDFWRERATATLTRAAAAEAAYAQLERERRRLGQAVQKVTRMPPRARLRGFAEAAAELGPFEAWILAHLEGGALQVAKSFGLEASSLILDRSSALASSFNRQSLLAAAAPGERAESYREARLFAERGMSTWLCVPFETGALALGARGPLEAAARGRVEAFVKRLAPVLRAWHLEAELKRERGLVRSLAMRLFSAGDRERARISRDLHDDHAQLLSAARLALTARRAEAAKMLEQLERQLRTRLIALRPPLLGRHTLAEAVGFELRRLSAAGVKTSLVVGEGARTLGRPIQQVCYQVTREAVSNIIRHARAKRVQVSVERGLDCARLKITDDGCGVGHDDGSRGGGLRGLAERVELLGGRWRLESRPGRTRLVAEIPEVGR